VGLQNKYGPYSPEICCKYGNKIIQLILTHYLDYKLSNKESLGAFVYGMIKGAHYSVDKKTCECRTMNVMKMKEM